jgi:IS6 family transposase
VQYLNNVVEQDHRAVKKRVWLAQALGSFAAAWRTLQAIEGVNWPASAERSGWRSRMPRQADFIATLFGAA